ncbi:hypothetical protein [Rhizobium sp. Leaf341]|uniref:hypothetical protein n=1 Tax=Rhizobium sp. Leaf341 TaxID=1736344 RepID=UPI000A8350DE|nr:hypothetical protein [Rhizobium sp. Leaf341]
MTLNRTALSVAVLVVILIAIGWLVISPSQDASTGGGAPPQPEKTQTVPNNPGPTTGAQ